MRWKKYYGQNVVPVDPNGEFMPKARKARRVPFGYIQSKDDPDLLVPNHELLSDLMQAIEYLYKSCSYRDTARWLSEATGIYMSHVGLMKIFKEFRRQLNAYKRNKAKNERSEAEEAARTA